MPLPFSNSRLEAIAASLVTGEEQDLLEPLMAGLDGNLVVGENSAPGVFDVEPTPFRQAAEEAIAEMAV